MIDLIRCGLCAAVIAATGCVSGCATIVKGPSQDIAISTEPAGAACELSRDGAAFATVDPTPGSVKVNKTSRDISISCKKKGFVPATGSLQSSFEGWTIGNFVLGGLIGLVIDFGSGAIHKYETELFVKLQPEAFTGDAQRDGFFDQWRAQVLQEAERTKVEIRKNCKDQCDALLAKADAETTSSLSQIEAMRGNAQVGQDSRFTSASPSSVASIVTPAVATPSAGPQVGDRWKYRLSQRGHEIGVVNVEIAQAGPNRVKERITRDGSPAFIAERDVETRFAPTRFERRVDLPGGYRLTEMAPYFPSGTQLTVGQQWRDVAGEYEILGHGSRKFSSSAKVTRRERIRVPAGEFDAWRVEIQSPELTGNSMHCTFWYATASLRSVKTILRIESPTHAAQANETYELLAFEPAK